MNSDELFAQGARCGHVEGKGRVGAYVLHEEFEACDVAVKAQGLASVQAESAWGAGYRHGYLLGAEGCALEKGLAAPGVKSAL